MRLESVCLSFVLAAAVAVSAAEDHPPAKPKPAVLMKGLGRHHHPIATKSAEAQRFFDQGFALVYGFNHEEAIRSFERAAELDPSAAMPLWGVAYALGPNINMDVDPEREKAAFEAVQKARKLAANAPPQERAYIETLATRYSDDPKADLRKLAEDYAKAMGELSKRYPDDLDAATLYAESLMDLRPWKLWTLDGKPAEGTEEIITTLESVLRRDPHHMGANHYYIHAVEASPHPERALIAAARLETLAPAAGHLVHMPGHVYMRTGDYMASVRTNEVAAKADESYLEASGKRGSMYDLMYYNHNLHFIAVSNALAGRLKDANAAANRLVKNASKGIEAFPILEFFLPTPTLVLMEFHRWDDVLKIPEPDAKLAMTNAYWRFARVSAFAEKGDVKSAKAERRALDKIAADIPEDADFGAYFNKSHSFLDIMKNVVDARIASAGGDHDAAIESWEKAVKLEDGLNYGEPPEWYGPIRESLGAEYLRAGKPEKAEEVFRDDLERNPRNGRSLFGLWKSLEAQKKSVDADFVRQQFETAWKDADVKLRIEEL